MHNGVANEIEARRSRTGPLAGLRVVEFAGLGPAPFACMLLSDMGADVVTVERPGRAFPERTDVVSRGRTLVRADLKEPACRDEVLELLGRADVLVEGFRPGVMERLGLGADIVHARNPRLVYSRMTGWGQSGPLAQAAGHDINYIAITGALHAIGTSDCGPVVPLNLVGDYGGGSLYLITGILAALLEARTSGRGQVVDAAISDGVISMMANTVTQAGRGEFREHRGSNIGDGSRPYYTTYETADDRHIAIGPIEPQFFADFCRRAGVPEDLRNAQDDASRWPELRNELRRLFRGKTQREWNSLLEGTDACYAPVLPLSEARSHPHIIAREAFVSVAGVWQPAPAPRFSRTPSAVQGPPPRVDSTVADVRSRWHAPARP